jgi:hypothetical protein
MLQRNTVQMQCHTGALGRAMTRLVVIVIYIVNAEAILFIVHFLKLEVLSVAPQKHSLKVVSPSFLVCWH